MSAILEDRRVKYANGNEIVVLNDMWNSTQVLCLLFVDTEMYGCVDVGIVLCCFRHFFSFFFLSLYTLPLCCFFFNNISKMFQRTPAQAALNLPLLVHFAGARGAFFQACVEIPLGVCKCPKPLASLKAPDHEEVMTTPTEKPNTRSQNCRKKRRKPRTKRK